MPLIEGGLFVQNVSAMPQKLSKSPNLNFNIEEFHFSSMFHVTCHNEHGHPPPTGTAPPRHDQGRGRAHASHGSLTPSSTPQPSTHRGTSPHSLHSSTVHSCIAIVVCGFRALGLHPRPRILHRPIQLQYLALLHGYLVGLL